MDKTGVIYILTNPSFPEYVKIGYADDIGKRLQQLNRSECEPKSVIQKFAKDLQLLEEIYLFESVHDRLADADGAFLEMR